MSRVEQKNLAIIVAVVGVLVAGGALLANYSGILQASSQPQEQPKVGCGGEGMVCARTEADAGGFPNVYAAVDAAPSEGCCPAEKAAGCPEKKPGGCCENPPAGCCEQKPGGCCENPPAGCCEAPPAGCCEIPQGGECCAGKADAATI